MRPRLILIAGVALILAAGLAWRALREAPLPELAPGPQALEQEAMAPQARLTPAVADAGSLPALPKQADAGIPELADVSFELLRGNERLVGERVELRGPAGSVGRPTDVMGYARFVLAPGRWALLSPRLGDVELEIRAPVSTFQLDTPFRPVTALERSVRGRVLDELAQPVERADLVVVVGNRAYRGGRSDALGRFAIESDAEALAVYATAGERRRSATRVLPVPAQDITLHLETWATLRVTAECSGQRSPFHLLATTEHGTTAAHFGTRCDKVEVPVGEVKLLARTLIDGQLWSGRARAEAIAGEETPVTVVLRPSPGIRGQVLTAQGLALPGVSVFARHAQELDGCGPSPPQRKRVLLPSELAGGDAGAELPLPAPVLGRYDAAASTDSYGRFELRPGGLHETDPTFQLTLVGPWKERRRLLARLGDEPLNIEAVPR